jgi:hypothetical protein
MKKHSIIFALLTLVILSSTFAQQTVKVGLRVSPMFAAAINGNSNIPKMLPTKKFRAGLQVDLALSRIISLSTGAEYANMEIQREVLLIPGQDQDVEKPARLMVPMGIKIYPIHGRKRHLFVRTELLNMIKTSPDVARSSSSLVLGIGIEKDIVDEKAKELKKQKKLRKHSIQEKQRSYYTGLSLIRPLGQDSSSQTTRSASLGRGNMSLIAVDLGYFF